MISSLLEYWLEIAFFPVVKGYWWISNLGLAMVILGELVRKSGNGNSWPFVHSSYQSPSRLITHGIYGLVRHPGYCGFFIWSVGSQIMLLNPISSIAFAVVVWKFFAGRIPYEEIFLRQFFNNEYDEYAERVPSGLPFVK